MKNDIKELNKIFENIKKTGWIKSRRKGTTGIGYTFESLIGKEEDSFPLPDFKSLEIKTIRKNSRRNVHLFSINPDGDVDNPIQKILNVLGYKKFGGQEIRCWIDVYVNKIIQLGYYKRVFIKVNRNRKKIELIALNMNNEKYNLNVSWSFDKIQERLNNKIKYLAVIIADSKIINNEEFFYYENINYYKVKNFDQFISLIENGKIIVSIKVQKRNGKYGGHGMDFTIPERIIEELYEKLDI